MIKIKQFLENLWLIYSIQDNEIKIKILGLQILAIITSFSEIFNIFSIKLFINLFIIGKDKLYDLWFIKLYFANYSVNTILLNTGILIILVILFSTYLRIFTLNYQFKISGIITLSLAKKIYNEIIEKSYSWHLANNTSKTITILSNDLDKVREQIIWGLSIVVNIILIFVISTYIIYSSPGAIIFLFIVSLFFLFFLFHQKNLLKRKVRY